MPFGRKVVSDYTNVALQNTNVKVFVRARPPRQGGATLDGMFNVNEGQKLSIRDPGRQVGEHAFMFDKLFWVDITQQSIFREVSLPLVERCMQGFNGCCFAYGQTGSGKTYSVFGESGEARGIIPRCVEYIFAALEKTAKAKEFALVVSFLEMYCDEIRDLGKAYLDKGPGLTSKQNTSEWWVQQQLRKRGQSNERDGSNRRPRQHDNAALGCRGDAAAVPSSGDEPYPGRGQLEIHEDVGGNVFVKGLSMIPVSTSEEAMNIVQTGFKLRATHETKMNKYSSRSHTVFTLNILQRDRATGEMVTGVLNLIDLAGSEKLNKSGSEGRRLHEALTINSSLSALGKVVMALDPSVPRSHIPYRDSKLTRLLQNSVGGNAYTALLATIYPIRSNYDECLSTLQFANRCRNVRNNPRVNYVYDQNDASAKSRVQLKKMNDELVTLRAQLARLRTQSKQRLESVLAGLGVNANVLDNGKVQLPNGAVLGGGDKGAAVASISGTYHDNDIGAREATQFSEIGHAGFRDRRSVHRLADQLSSERMKTTRLQDKMAKASSSKKIAYSRRRSIVLLVPRLRNSHSLHVFAYSCSLMPRH